MTTVLGSARRVQQAHFAAEAEVALPSAILVALARVTSSRSLGGAARR